MDSEQLDEFIKKKCSRDCVVISNSKIKKNEAEKLIKLIGKDLFQELENIANEVHNTQFSR